MLPTLRTRSGRVTKEQGEQRRRRRRAGQWARRMRISPGEEMQSALSASRASSQPADPAGWPTPRHCPSGLPAAQRYTATPLHSKKYTSSEILSAELASLHSQPFIDFFFLICKVFKQTHNVLFSIKY